MSEIIIWYLVGFAISIIGLIAIQLYKVKTLTVSELLLATGISLFSWIVVLTMILIAILNGIEVIRNCYIVTKILKYKIVDFK